jgi:hypothetical protein
MFPRVIVEEVFRVVKDPAAGVVSPSVPFKAPPVEFNVVNVPAKGVVPPMMALIVPPRELRVVNDPAPPVITEALRVPVPFVVIRESILMAEAPAPKTAALLVNPAPVTFPPLPPPPPPPFGNGGGGTALIVAVRF